MERCNKLVDVGRRQFLRGSAFAAAGMATAVALPTQAKAAPGLALVEYPSNKLANVADLKPNEPLDVGYPDADAPGVLLKLGTRVEGGAGPDGDIVGFSTICPAQGLSAQLQRRRSQLQLPRPLFALRRGCGRTANLGPVHFQSPSIRAARRRQGRYLCRGRG